MTKGCFNVKIITTMEFKILIILICGYVCGFYNVLIKVIQFNLYIYEYNMTSYKRYTKYLYNVFYSSITKQLFLLFLITQSRK